MLFVLNIVQIVISLLLAVSILLQQRGGGLSATFGGSGEVYRTRRGMEKVIYRSTIILAILFLITAALNIFLR
jgi:preprotein translocase subunit SecG